MEGEADSDALIAGAMIACALLVAAASVTWLRPSPREVPPARPAEAGGALTAGGPETGTPARTPAPAPAARPETNAGDQLATASPRRPEDDVQVVGAPDPVSGLPTEPEPPAADLFGQIAKVRIPQRVIGLELSPDKATAYAASGDKSLYVIDVATRQVTRRLTGHRAPIADMAISDDGTRLVTCGADRTIRVWQLTTGQTTQVIPLPLPPHRIALSPDGRTIVTSLMVTAPVFPRPGMSPAHRDFRSLMRFDADTGEVLEPITEDRQTMYWSIAFSPNEALLAAGSKDGLITLLDRSSGEVVNRITNRPGPTYVLRFTGDGSRLYAGNDLFITGYSLPEGETVYRYGLRSAVKGIDMNADETRFLAEGTIDVRLVEADKIGPEAVTSLHGHESPLSGLLFLADETQAISSAWDGTVRVWKLPRQR